MRLLWQKNQGKWEKPFWIDLDGETVILNGDLERAPWPSKGLDNFAQI